MHLKNTKVYGINEVVLFQKIQWVKMKNFWNRFDFSDESSDVITHEEMIIRIRNYDNHPKRYNMWVNTSTLNVDTKNKKRETHTKSETHTSKLFLGSATTVYNQIKDPITGLILPAYMSPSYSTPTASDNDSTKTSNNPGCTAHKAKHKIYTTKHHKSNCTCKNH